MTQILSCNPAQHSNQQPATMEAETFSLLQELEVHQLELELANKELLFQNKEKAERTAELIISNELIAFQRDRLEKIANLVPGVVYQYRLRPDGSSCFPYASDAIQSVYRVSPEEVREDASKVFSNLHPDDHDEVVASMLQSAKDLSPWKLDYRVKFEDGTIRYLNGNSMPQLEADGSVLWHGFISDITERKQMEEISQNSEHSYHTLIECTPNAVVIQCERKIIYANPAAVAMFGATSLQELAGTSIWDHIHPDYHFIVKERLQGIMDTPIQELKFLKLDGTVFDAEVQGTQIIYDGRHCIHVAMQNISERKEREQKIILQNKELKKLSAEKDIFFSIIAHDLRGPMGVLMQLSELMVDEKTGLTPAQMKELTISLSKTSRNTFNLLVNLLEWAKVRRRLYDFKPQSINLQKIVAECINIFTEQAGGKNIELVSEIADGTEVIADKNMLQSIIQNLLSNAIKYSNMGGKVTLSAKTDENNQTLVSVKDTGIGMTEVLRNKLFRIEENTKRPGTQGEQSTGLGLLLCKEFIELQGGSIGVESEQEIGSVFSFNLPAGGIL